MILSHALQGAKFFDNSFSSAQLCVFAVGWARGQNSQWLIQYIYHKVLKQYNKYNISNPYTLSLGSFFRCRFYSPEVTKHNETPTAVSLWNGPRPGGDDQCQPSKLIIWRRALPFLPRSDLLLLMNQMPNTQVPGYLVWSSWPALYTLGSIRGPGLPRSYTVHTFYLWFHYLLYTRKAGIIFLVKACCGFACSLFSHVGWPNIKRAFHEETPEVKNQKCSWYI